MVKRVMMGKPTLPGSADAWVGNVAQQDDGETEKVTKRLTLDIPKKLHGRFKASCAINEKAMVDVILEFLEKTYPE